MLPRWVLWGNKLVLRGRNEFYVEEICFLGQQTGFAWQQWVLCGRNGFYVAEMGFMWQKWVYVAEMGVMYKNSITNFYVAKHLQWHEPCVTILRDQHKKPCRGSRVQRQHEAT